MIMSCVKRVRERLGYHVGKTLIIQTLRGSAEARLLSLKLDGLSTYGLMKNVSAQSVRDYIDYLETAGYLRTDPEHSTLELTGRASAVLFHGETVEMPIRSDRAIRQPDRRRKRKSSPAVLPAEEGLLAKLKAVRTLLAQEDQVPAYIVFSNATLSDMAAKAPRTIPELLTVSGVGTVKAGRYGKAFLEAIAEYVGE